MGRNDVSDTRQRNEPVAPPCNDMSVMRIAVAGTGGLARLIAYFIQADTSHHVIFLSRNQQPQLSGDGYQVAVVDYGNPATLEYALRGIDTVISTVTGRSQIALITAAVRVRVRRFVPAEFEGLPQLRAADDPLDRGRLMARQCLDYYSQHIQSTSFIVGILYERFQPGGMARQRFGATSGLGGEGDFIMNPRTMTAQAPALDENEEPNATICMTAAQDVARFVCRALDLPTWPSELRICGQRIRVEDLVLQMSRLRGRIVNVHWHGPASLRDELQVAQAANDFPRQIRVRALLNTSRGCYDFDVPELPPPLRDMTTTPFEAWFTHKWANQ